MLAMLAMLAIPTRHRPNAVTQNAAPPFIPAVALVTGWGVLRHGRENDGAAFVRAQSEPRSSS
jgi:hypothetical protein